MHPLANLSAALAVRFSHPAGGFAAASAREATVFGSRRPGFPFPLVPERVVTRWIVYMQAQGITRVLCLLPTRQLRGYHQLIETYRQSFGTANVCWSPIDDFTLANITALTQMIIPFLAESEREQQRVVVHCSGGVGRTGHILAAWLVSSRGMSNEQAIEAVRQTGRNPRESRDPGLERLLDACRTAFAT